jgi:hypothetical protein
VVVVVVAPLSSMAPSLIIMIQFVGGFLFGGGSLLATWGAIWREGACRFLPPAKRQAWCMFGWIGVSM